MLPSWVSHCHIDGHTIFLDVAANRYTALAPEVAKALIAGDWAKVPPGILRQADRFGWIRSNSRAARSTCGPIVVPGREFSAEVALGATSFKNVRSAILALLGMRLALRVSSLDALLRRVQLDNSKTDSSSSPGRLKDLVGAFEAAERFVVGNDQCLLRSLALQRFLARNGHPSTFVFGIKMHPFAAHCWIQQEDVLLNDTLETVGAFRPIRAVA